MTLKDAIFLLSLFGIAFSIQVLDVIAWVLAH